MRWKAIKGLEGYYEVSDTGLVRSLNGWQRAVSKGGKEFYRRKDGRILSQGDSRGYRIVNLPHPAGGFKSAKVHFLVAQAFVRGRGVSVNHKNGVKHDNRAENLEWASMAWQQQHAVKEGLRKQSIKVKGTRIKDKEVFCFPSMAQAAIEVGGYRAGGRYIGLCVGGKMTSVYGYTWERIDEVLG